MNARSSLTDLIGNTPLLRLERLAPDQQIYAKCEFLEPRSPPPKLCVADDLLDAAVDVGKSLPFVTTCWAIISAGLGEKSPRSPWVTAVRCFPVP